MVMNFVEYCYWNCRCDVITGVVLVVCYVVRDLVDSHYCIVN
jgi:hypothetical protein